MLKYWKILIAHFSTQSERLTPCVFAAERSTWKTETRRPLKLSTRPRMKEGQEEIYCTIWDFCCLAIPIFSDPLVFRAFLRLRFADGEDLTLRGVSKDSVLGWRVRVSEEDAGFRRMSVPENHLQRNPMVYHHFTSEKKSGGIQSYTPISDTLKKNGFVTLVCRTSLRVETAHLCPWVIKMAEVKTCETSQSNVYINMNQVLNGSRPV